MRNADVTNAAMTSLHTLATSAVVAMATGTRADIEGIVAPSAINHEAKAEPPACRVPGPSGVYATAEWLRAAYSELAFDVHTVVSEGDLVALHCTMRGRHTGTFVTYRADGEVGDAFPATGRTFVVTQTHWLRFAGTKVIEHWANRDDIGQALQLGWVPPTPLFLIRMAVAKWRARRAAKMTPGPRPEHVTGTALGAEGSRTQGAVRR